MTAPYRKKLIEVALPLKAINEASAREKSIRHGHPSTLHLWWARRPLAACRAVLFASLVDDPDSDPAYRKADGTVDEDRAGVKRAQLFNLIEELVQWENSNNPRVINAARAEIARCVASRKIELGELKKDDHFRFSILDFGFQADDARPDDTTGTEENPKSKPKSCRFWDFLTMQAPPAAVNAFLAEYAPPVLDPFCGGGSIPLEAQRLGLRAYASDLNPVAVLITKALIEIPPKFAGSPPVNPESNPGARASRSQEDESNATETMGLPQKTHPGWHSRGYLPHFDAPGLVQSITFRLHDALPRRVVESWAESTDIEKRRKAESYLDAGHGASFLKDPRVAEIVQHALIHFDEERYRLLAWCIMPNHVHAMIETRQGHPLSDVVHSWKSFTAKEANKVLGRKGAFWAADYFDRYIRDADHAEQAFAYIENNPVQAGLVSAPEAWAWSSAGARARARVTSNDTGARASRPLDGTGASHPLDGTGASHSLDGTGASHSLKDESSAGARASRPLPLGKEGSRPLDDESSKSRASETLALPRTTLVLPGMRGWEGAQGLAEDVRYYGQWMRDEAEKRIGRLYPKVKITEEMAKDRPDLEDYVGQELTVIAWLWARTVASPNPAVGGAHVPLVRSFWLSTKKGKEAYVEPVIDRKTNTYRFVVRTGKPRDKAAVDAGTKLGRGCKFRCVLRDQPIPESHIKNAGMEGELGATLLAVVAEGVRGRVYLSPQHVPAVHVDRPKDLRGIEAPIALDKRAIWCLLYGLDTFDKLFTPRQLVALTAFSDLVQEARAKVLADAQATWDANPKSRIENPKSKSLADGGTGPQAYADAVATYLAFAVSKAADRNSDLCSWEPGMDRLRSTFGRQALPMVWDYSETNPFADAAGDIFSAVDTVAKVMDRFPRDSLKAGSNQLDATTAINGAERPIISTDPPYYDNIGYADLSDFFYAWLRRSLKGVYPSLFATALTPKAQELIASPYRHDGDKRRAQDFFETGLGKAFARMHEAHAADFPLTVYYAFKQQEVDDASPGPRASLGARASRPHEDEDGAPPSLGARASRLHNDEDAAETAALPASTGWETMLAGLIRSGFAITGTWPMRTELGNRMVGLGTNALASSIVLVCRPRADDASLATRKDFVNALRQELPEALKSLQHGNIAPVDLAQSAIGPGMAVFTRYAKVIESDGSPMTVRTALGIINQVLDEVLAEQEGDFDADTRWALAWFEQHGMDEGPFGVAETLSKAKNTAVNALVEAGIVKSRGGKVQLLSRRELPDNWDPVTDSRLRHWEVVQHLIRTLETKGETEAAKLLNRLGGLGETARELAYRLYSICERKKWADEALAYNSLVIAWPELSKLALSTRNRQSSTQQDFGF